MGHAVHICTQDVVALQDVYHALASLFTVQRYRSGNCGIIKPLGCYSTLEFSSIQLIWLNSIENYTIRYVRLYVVHAVGKLLYFHTHWLIWSYIELSSEPAMQARASICVHIKYINDVTRLLVTDQVWFEYFRKSTSILSASKVYAK